MSKAVNDSTLSRIVRQLRPDMTFYRLRRLWQDVIIFRRLQFWRILSGILLLIFMGWLMLYLPLFLETDLVTVPTHVQSYRLKRTNGAEVYFIVYTPRYVAPGKEARFDLILEQDNKPEDGQKVIFEVGVAPDTLDRMPTRRVEGEFLEDITNSKWNVSQTLLLTMPTTIKGQEIPFLIQAHVPDPNGYTFSLSHPLTIPAVRSLPYLLLVFVFVTATGLFNLSNVGPWIRRLLGLEFNKEGKR